MAQPTLLAIAKADLISMHRYYPTKIIRRDVIVKVIREVQNWHKNLAKQGIR